MTGEEKQNRIKELEAQNKEYSKQYKTLKNQFDSIEETAKKITVGIQISMQLETIQSAIDTNEDELRDLKSN